MSTSFWRRGLVAVGRRAMVAGLHAKQYDMKKNGEAWLIRKIGPSLKEVIDVGANGGEWSETVLQHASLARVVSVEPIPPFAESVQARLNGRVVVENVALSDSEGEVVIYQAGGGGSAVPVTSKPLIPHKVRMTTGDALAAKHDLSSLDFIKVDTDGYDMPVLRGFSGVAEKQRPVFQFEYSRFWIKTRHFLADAYEYFEELDYDVGRLMPRSIDFMSYKVSMDVFLTNNFVAIPREKRSLLD